MEFSLELQNLFNEFNKKVDLIELENPNYQFNNDDDQFSYIIYPFFKVYPYILIIINNHEKRISRHVLYENVREFECLIESSGTEIRTFEFDEVLELIAHLVVDLFPEEDFNFQLFILEKIAKSCKMVLETYDDPRMEKVKRVEPDLKFCKPNYDYFFEEDEAYVTFTIGALFKARDKQKDYLLQIIDRNITTKNKLLYIFEDFDELSKEDIDVEYIKREIEDIAGEYQYFNKHCFIKKYPLRLNINDY